MDVEKLFGVYGGVIFCGPVQQDLSNLSETEGPEGRHFFRLFWSKFPSECLQVHHGLQGSLAAGECYCR